MTIDFCCKCMTITNHNVVNNYSICQRCRKKTLIKKEED